MEYNLCYDIDYKCVFDVDRVVFWATRIKDVSHRKHRVRLLYPALAVSDITKDDTNVHLFPMWSLKQYSLKITRHIILITII